MVGKQRRVGEIHRADLPGRQFLIVLVENPDLADDGAADGAAVRQPLLRGRHRDAIAFGTGVILDQDRSPPFDHLRLDVDRAGRGGVNRALQRGDVVAPPHFFGQFQHAHEHGRHQLRLGDLVLLDQFQKLLGVERFHDDRGAAERDRHPVEAQGSGVIQRRRRQIDAVGRHAAHIGAEKFQERIWQVDRIALELVLDAFGPAGGARRIQHVVAADFVRNPRGRLPRHLAVPRAKSGQRFIDHIEQRCAGRVRDQPPDLLGAFRRGDDDPRAAVLDDVGDLVLGEVAADRGVIQPAALRRPADFHERQPVLEQERHVIAGLQAECAEQMRALVRQFVELAIGDRLAAAGHLIGDLVRLGPRMHRRMSHGIVRVPV